ncbi:GxxExxY protein [Planctomycetales bacterium ZRK34]|nr:GxxExxY protein [Planctomycetales bacterium ZRK34]
MNTDEHRSSIGATNHAGLTERIIEGAFRVSNQLGSGFLEKVYENALTHELRKMGLHTVQQQPIHVYYEGIVVGEYVADLIVENNVLIELKSCRAIDDIHVAQCLNYLRATQIPVGLVLNFGTPKVGIKRLMI